jgi:hypothetical protein
LSITHPELCKEWGFEKNYPLTPNDVSFGSHKVVWWKCDECRGDWAASIRERSLYHRGCSECSGNRKRTLDEVTDAFSMANLTLLSVNYKNSYTRLLCCCEKGHLFAISYDKLRVKHGCSLCSNGRPVSYPETLWLDKLGIYFRQHSIWVDGKLFRVDGFDPETNTIYEFLGDFYHGNPARFAPEAFNKKLKKTFGQLYEETFKKLESLAAAGYTVIYVWEKDFNGR